MTRPDIDAMDAIVAKATKGPWRADNEYGELSGIEPAWCVSKTNEAGEYLGDILYAPQGTAPRYQGDAEFAAAAREYIPAINTYVREIERKNLELRYQAQVNRSLAANLDREAIND